MLVSVQHNVLLQMGHTQLSLLLLFVGYVNQYIWFYNIMYLDVCFQVSGVIGCNQNPAFLKFFISKFR